MLHRTNARAGGNDLYRAVLNEVEDLLKQLDIETHDTELSEALQKVEDIVEPIHTELVERIETLQSNARWDKFTIAFYGETNAGKSTTIETLRTLLGEKSKLEAQKKFHAMQAERGLSEAALNALQTAIDQDTEQFEALRLKAIDASAQRDGEHAAYQQRIAIMQDELDASKRRASMWRKLVHLFRKMPEEVAFEQAQQGGADLDAAHAAARTGQDAEIEAARVRMQSRIEARQHALADLDSLAPYADGYIVGTGRSDFTRETHPYEFEVDGQRFEVLDVPGIEGKEADVINSILQAVTSAHAVFYITGKAAPPQTGDENGLGTLEKIRKHLGDHTEVWSIYNKRITNPIQLEKGELLSADERRGIDALDATMREHLGEQYRSCIALSAQPAFLAAAECLVPHSDNMRNRAKFLSKFSVEDVVSRTGFRSFVDLMTGSMIAGAEDRMRLANVNKVHHAIHSAATKLADQQKNLIQPLANSLRKDWKHVDQQLDLTVGGLSHDMLNLALDAVTRFETKVRNAVYAKIDCGIGNDELKATLGSVIQSEQAALEIELKDEVKNKLEGFQSDVEKTLERFKQRANELQHAYRSMAERGFNRDFEFDMEFDSGVKYGALLSALAGGVLMIWNPVGWVSLAIGGLTIIVSIAKALWSLIDEDFKRGQQRKVTDENLGRVVDAMRAGVVANCADLRKHVDEQIAAIKDDARHTVDQAIRVNESLAGVCVSLSRFEKKLSVEDLKTDGKKQTRSKSRTETGTGAVA